MKLTAILDGDIIAYQAATGAEKPVNWGEGHWTLHAYEQDVQEALENALATLTEDLGCDRVIVCLTDGVNWRKDVLPSYKENRAEVRKPMLLPWARQWLLENRETFLRPTLEGDDIMGILATHPKLVRGDRVLVTIDKDLKTIPGQHYHLRDKKHFTVGADEAARWHMLQTLTGDTTDGYKGCPGVGPKKAEAILEGATGYAELWPRVVAAYERAKLTAEDALVQARVARILQHTDYNFNKKEVILWEP